MQTQKHLRQYNTSTIVWHLANFHFIQQLQENHTINDRVRLCDSLQIVHGNNNNNIYIYIYMCVCVCACVCVCVEREREREREKWIVTTYKVMAIFMQRIMLQEHTEREVILCKSEVKNVSITSVGLHTSPLHTDSSCTRAVVVLTPLPAKKTGSNQSESTWK